MAISITRYPNQDPLTSAAQNIPIASAETQINNILNGTEAFEELAFGSPVELTISGGSITVTQTFHTIDTEGDASTDDLEQISGAVQGAIYIFAAANGARDVVIKDQVNNIFTYDSTDVTLDNTRKFVIGVYDGTDMRILGYVGGGGGSGLYTSLAILRDEKTSGTHGGSSTSATWNARDLNTEDYDPDAIVSIASNEFTPIAGDYIIEVTAQTYISQAGALRLYNVTGSSVVGYGINDRSGSSDATANMSRMVLKFTANGTDAYRIDQYTETGTATFGLGVRKNISGVPETYMKIILYKLS